MINIKELLESVDLDFEPRWVSRDDEGDVVIWAEKPVFTEGQYLDYWTASGKYHGIEKLKLAEFDGKDGVDCIYEVPRKTSGMIEKLERHIEMDNDSAKSCPPSGEEFMYKINELIDVVNKHADIIQQIGDWGTRKGECLWCETLTSVNLEK
jgi:hypothetical protein